MLLEFPSAVQAQEYKLRSARSSPICGTGVFSLDRLYGQALGGVGRSAEWMMASRVALVQETQKRTVVTMALSCPASTRTKFTPMPDFDENLPKDSSSGPDVRREWL